MDDKLAMIAAARPREIRDRFQAMTVDERQQLIYGPAIDAEVGAALLLGPRIGAVAELTEADRAVVLRKILPPDALAGLDQWEKDGEGLRFVSGMLAQLSTWVQSIGGGDRDAPKPAVLSVEEVVRRSAAAGA